MKEAYDFKEVEPKINKLWDKSDYAKPSDSARKRYSTFLNPPNASGPMHIGNALMVAMQDMLVRHRRAKGESVLWIPGTDHGGYETQVTFEQELESKGKSKDDYTKRELYEAISSFVENNNRTIAGQLKTMGASVDWSDYRFTLDDQSLAYMHRMFTKMLGDGLIYRNLYMVYYCPVCTTVLADVELKEVEQEAPLYHVRFPVRGADASLSFVTSRPEFLYTVTHVLAHPQDARLAPYIGKELINPSTGEPVQVVASKRKFDPATQESVPAVFLPSYSKYDFEYAIRNGIPSQNLFGWSGEMLERYPGLAPEAARAKEVEYLTKAGAIERIEEPHQHTSLMCKKGHEVQSVLRMTWFLKLDDERVPLRKPALEAVERDRLVVYPFWRKKGLVEWLGKMHDWPIARQNVWGIRIPLWYEVTNPSLFTVWYRDTDGEKRFGNLAELLEQGVSLKEIREGLERIYATEEARWTLEPQKGKEYLPETDTFDTWVSSSAWGMAVFDPAKVKSFYPSDIIIAGYDLLRLWVARKILLGVYMTGRLPFKRVFLNSLIRAKDGQKMSKSLGNAITLDHYLKTYGADITRLALVSYTSERGDFHVADDRLGQYLEFANRLWTMGRISNTANTYKLGMYDTRALTNEDKELLSALVGLESGVDVDIDKHQLSQAQEKVVSFLHKFEVYNASIQSRDDAEHAVAVFNDAFKKYITLLHPFMPFMTEAIDREVYKSPRLLAETVLK